MGLTGGTFKERYNNHTKSLKHKKYEKETELSKYIWDLKGQEIPYTIHWEIVRKSNCNMRQSGQCNLCLEEKLELLTIRNALKKRSEVVNKCRHGNKPQNRAKKK